MTSFLGFLLPISSTELLDVFKKKILKNRLISDFLAYHVLSSLPPTDVLPSTSSWFSIFDFSVDVFLRFLARDGYSRFPPADDFQLTSRRLFKKLWEKNILFWRLCDISAYGCYFKNIRLLAIFSGALNVFSKIFLKNSALFEIFRCWNNGWMILFRYVGWRFEPYLR